MILSLYQWEKELTDCLCQALSGRDPKSSKEDLPIWILATWGKEEPGPGFPWRNFRREERGFS